MKVSRKAKKSIVIALCFCAAMIVVGCRHHDPSAQFNYTLIPFEDETGLFGYMETDGDIVIEPQFEEAGPFSNDMALVRIDGEYGYIDEDGKMVIPAIYADGTSFRQEMAFVRAKENHYICITKEGKMKFEIMECKEVRPFSEGMAPFCGIYGKWGYVNMTGEIVYIPTFEMAGDFHEGVAAVQMHGKWGLINSEGEYVVEPKYKSLGFEKYCAHE